MEDRFERFLLAIAEIDRHWHRIAEEEMGRCGLRSSHAMYLAALRRYPEGLTAARLAETCGKDKADVSRMTAILQKKGLMIKEGGGYGGRYRLTPAGEELADHVRQRADVAVRLAGSHMDEARRSAFYDDLEQIAERLRSIRQEGLPPQ